jgi:lysozyme
MFKNYVSVITGVIIGFLVGLFLFSSCSNSEKVYMYHADEIVITQQKPIVCVDTNEFNDGSKNVSLEKTPESVLNGLDVSRWQGKINWKEVYKSNYDFVFIRLANGTKLDVNFYKNWKDAKSAGLIVGAYQFIRPSQSIEEQSKLIIEVLKNVKFSKEDLPIVYDLEVNEGKDKIYINNITNKWITSIQKNLNVTPIIYGSHKGTISLLENKFSNNPLWIAHYNTDKPKIPNIWKDWTFWQKSETGYISGIKGNVDINVYKGTKELLKEFIMNYNKLK